MIISFILAFAALVAAFTLGSYLTFKSIQKAGFKAFLAWFKSLLKTKK